jgi:hypothetical protein
MLPKQFVVDIYRKQVDVYGKVLGQAVFLRQTGMSSFPWRGGYWRSWSEFQAECGFTPNKPKLKSPRGVLLHHYALLALELKRLPTYPDMKLRRKQEPSFPSSETFMTLGTHDQFMLKLEAFCEGKPEFAPVAAMLAERRRHFITRDRSGHKAVRGFVYLCRAGQPEHKTYRLGHEHGGYRLGRRLATRLSFRRDTIHVIDTDDPEGIERYWRRRFRPYLMRRNVYRLDWDDVIAFRLRRFQ